MTHTEVQQIQYTQEELADFGKRLARLQQELEALTDQRKASMDDFKSQMTAVKTAIVELSAEVDRGFRIVEHKCDVILNTPQDGMKSYINQSTLETVRIAPMTIEDRGGSLMSGSGQ